MSSPRIPFVPENIIVHLGRPGSTAANVRVPFPEYIKGVASREIYPTWPENSLRANILAQISFALNRVYTEWYRSKGYDFDITNSTQYDMAFTYGGEVFDNINRIVDEIFNNYVRRIGTVEPYFTEFCNGTTVTCDGMSQWGTVSLANQGYSPLGILQYYYGDDLELVTNAPIRAAIESYPGFALRRGMVSNDVYLVQIELNRIADNYPAIPKIVPTNGAFGIGTYNAVLKFQQIFNLEMDGVVGKATWYKLKFIFSSVKRLGELSSEGITYEEIATLYPIVLQQGSRGFEVRALQYYLNVLAKFYPTYYPVAMDGIFGPETDRAVRRFQEYNGLTADGVVGNRTWERMDQVYRSVVETIPSTGNRAKLYPGRVLTEGDTGQDVTDLQTYLALIGKTYTAIPEIPVTGYFGTQTANAVRVFQQAFGLPVEGFVGPVTWDAIANEYNAITLSGF